MEKTLLVIAPAQGEDCPFYIFVAKTGECLASHFCSNEDFAYGDLYANRPERIEDWTKRFGELDVKYIDKTDISIEEIGKRNKNWYEETQKQKENEK